MRSRSRKTSRCSHRCGVATWPPPLFDTVCALGALLAFADLAACLSFGAPYAVSASATLAMDVKNTIRFIIVLNFPLSHLTLMALDVLRCFCLATLLARCFEQHNCNCCRQIQTSRPVHRDRDAIVDVGGEQILRQPLCLAAENEKIVLPKRHIVISMFGFRRQKKITCLR